MALRLGKVNAQRSASGVDVKAAATLSACAEGTLTMLTTVFPMIRLPKEACKKGAKWLAGWGVKRVASIFWKGAKASAAKPSFAAKSSKLSNCGARSFNILRHCAKRRFCSALLATKSGYCGLLYMLSFGHEIHLRYAMFFAAHLRQLHQKRLLLRR